MNLYIRAMSDYDRDIRRKIVDASVPLIKHLIKMILYPDSEYVNGWKKEIYAFISDVPKTKRTKKYPSYKFMLEALSTRLDTLYSLKMGVIGVMEESGLYPAPVSDETIESICTDYVKWLAKELSTKGYVIPKEVYSWIDNNILNT